MNRAGLSAAALRSVRVAVTIDSLTVPRWIGLVLEQLAQADFVDLAVVIVLGDAALTNSESPTRRQDRKPFLFRLYEHVDYRHFRADADAFAPVDAQHVLDGRARLANGGPAGSARALAGEDVDVVVRLDSGALSDPPRPVPSFGVWSLRHGDGDTYSGDPPLFWEMYDGHSVSGATLELHREGGARTEVIYRSYSSTDPVSLYRNRNASYWKAARFVVRSLRDLHRVGSVRAAGQGGPEATPRKPSNLCMAWFFLKLTARVLRRRVRDTLFREQWFIAYREVTGGQQTRLLLVEPPPGRSIMDPFLIEREGEHFVFVEDYDVTARKAAISYVRIRADGPPSPPALALERAHHLSYPFVFERDGSYFMIPETSAARTVELHRAEAFPDRWVHVTNLLEDVLAVDSTLLEHEGRLWLFVNLAEEGISIEDELFLFMSDSLVGPWRAHPRNPIVSDVRSARPAGRLFQRDGHLIRPSQDSSGIYGRSVAFNRIDVLTETEYREVTVGRIEPGWLRGNLGTHCYSVDSRYEVVDGRRWRLRWDRTAFREMTPQKEGDGPRIVR